MKRKFDESVKQEKLLEAENNDIKEKNQKVVAEQEKLNTKVAELEKDLLKLGEKFKDSQKKVTDLEGERDAVKNEHAALIVKYNEACDYLHDQANSVKYEQENPYGKVPVPKLDRINI